MKFSVIITRDCEDGGYVASCPALPGCNSQGETFSEVRDDIRDAVKGCLQAKNTVF